MDPDGGMDSGVLAASLRWAEGGLACWQAAWETWVPVGGTAWPSDETLDRLEAAPGDWKLLLLGEVDRNEECGGLGIVPLQVSPRRTDDGMTAVARYRPRLLTGVRQRELWTGRSLSKAASQPKPWFGDG